MPVQVLLLLGPERVLEREGHRGDDVACLPMHPLVSCCAQEGWNDAAHPGGSCFELVGSLEQKAPVVVVEGTGSLVLQEDDDGAVCFDCDVEDKAVAETVEAATEEAAVPGERMCWPAARCPTVWCRVGRGPRLRLGVAGVAVSEPAYDAMRCRRGCWCRWSQAPQGTVGVTGSREGIQAGATCIG